MIPGWLHLLFPPKCVLCKKVLSGAETDLCHSCRCDSPLFTGNRVRLPFIDSWVAIWRYEGAARKSILRYKFSNHRSYAAVYGRLLAMKIQEEYPEGFDLLTWVPISRLRRLRRGFDQVELLARAVGRELGMEPVSLLKKIRHNRPQSRVRGDAQRRANVLGAYRMDENAPIKDKKILLLDDIITTGATAGECARVLLTAGAGEVYCAAVACARYKSKK